MKKVPSLTKNILFKDKLSSTYIVNMSFLLLFQDFKILSGWDDVCDGCSDACILNHKFIFSPCSSVANVDF